MENENQDLKEKLSQTENNLGMFIKEMSELLDNHEISTNIGTDDNYSLNNSNNNNNNVNFDQNLEEELENLIRLKGKTQEEERDNFNAKSLATKENRLLSQNAKNVIKSNRSNANTFRKNKK